VHLHPASPLSKKHNVLSPSSPSASKKADRFGREAEVPLRELRWELLEFDRRVVATWSSAVPVEYIHTISERSHSAERQLRVYPADRDLKDVVRQPGDGDRASVQDSNRTPRGRD